MSRTAWRDTRTVKRFGCLCGPGVTLANHVLKSADWHRYSNGTLKQQINSDLKTLCWMHFLVMMYPVDLGLRLAAQYTGYIPQWLVTPASVTCPLICLCRLFLTCASCLERVSYLHWHYPTKSSPDWVPLTSTITQHLTQSASIMFTFHVS